VDLSVVFAGTAGSVPTARRGLPATLVRRGGDRILFDCGEGTQRQLIRTVGLPEIREVFITHLHLDHWLGLPGMITSFGLRGRTRQLTVFGPPGLRAAVGRVVALGRLGYHVEVAELDDDEVIDYDDFSIEVIGVRHRGPPAYGYVLREAPRPGRFDAALAEARGVRPGPDFGRLQHGEVVDGVRPEEVIGEERPGRTVVLSGDTAPCDAVRAAAYRADLLVHDATFTDEELDRAMETRHSTARQAAEIALESEVRMLALTHLSTRYGGGEIKREARAVFENSVVPRDGDVIDVPFAEKGPPELIRAEDAHVPAGGPA
jgi:ribonuclease Z